MTQRIDGRMLSFGKSNESENISATATADFNTCFETTKPAIAKFFETAGVGRTMKSLMVSCLLLCAFRVLGAQQKGPALNGDEKAIVAQLKTLRAVPDDKRGEVTKNLALQIRKLPADGAKVGLANSLANLSTEGDFGHDTLQEVATTLADALREQPSQRQEPYSELASLIRYEHVQVSFDSAPLREAMAQLEANDRDRQNADFTLTDLAGKKWRLKELRDRVVLVNFWATWCPPCRKEMPDLDALYRTYEKKGLVVLAISDEDGDKVNAFLASHNVSYPVLLDAGRKVNEEFHVEGIPKSFIYDRQGKLAAQSIDMRTRGQFVAMLKAAGLEVGDREK